jgi:hypothetical protein
MPITEALKSSARKAAITTLGSHRPDRLRPTLRIWKSLLNLGFLVEKRPTTPPSGCDENQIAS